MALECEQHELEAPHLGVVSVRAHPSQRVQPLLPGNMRTNLDGCSSPSAFPPHQHKRIEFNEHVADGLSFDAADASQHDVAAIAELQIRKPIMRRQYVCIRPQLAG